MHAALALVALAAFAAARPVADPYNRCVPRKQRFAPNIDMHCSIAFAVILTAAAASPCSATR